MQLGMIALGRMGANLVRRVMRDWHKCVVYDPNPDAVKALVAEGATGVVSVPDLVGELKSPRAVWVMVPAGAATDSVITGLANWMESGDTVIDGENSYYRDDIRRAKRLANEGFRLLDRGTRGGVWGLERGYSLMIGGDADAFAQVEPIFASLAPGVDSAERTPGRDGDVAPVRAGLPTERGQRCRTLREDGPQRHRVRDDGGHRRGPEHHAQGEHRRPSRPSRRAYPPRC